MITVKHHGSFTNTTRFLTAAMRLKLRGILEQCAKDGVAQLSQNTPVDTGVTAHSWNYTIEIRPGGYTIIWSNSHVHNGVSVALILQYGHGTGNGGYIRGIDYINPALEPVFAALKEKLWKEVTSL